MNFPRSITTSLLRRILCAFCALLLLNLMTGCAVYRYEIRLVEEMPELEPRQVREAVLQSGEIVRFDEKSGAVHDARTGSISGHDSSGAMITLDERDVLYLNAEVRDTAGSFILSSPVYLALCLSLFFIAIGHRGGLQ